MKEKILKAIEEIYCKKYVGYLKISTLKPFGIDVALGLNNWERPIHILALMNDTDFIEYFKLELRTRHLDNVFFYEGYKLDSVSLQLDTPQDKKKIEELILIIEDKSGNLILTKDINPLITDDYGI